MDVMCNSTDAACAYKFKSLLLPSMLSYGSYMYEFQQTV